MKPLLPAILLLAFTASLSAQSTWYVPDDFSTIQLGIDGSSNGDTVIVRDGTYFENINFNGQAITLKSEYGPATTIIDGMSNGTTGVSFASGEGSDSILEGFTVTNCSTGVGAVGGGIGVHAGASPVIRGNWIVDNTRAVPSGRTASGAGAAISGDGTLFENNIVRGNTTIGSHTWGGGVVVGGSASLGIIVRNNLIYENTAASWPGGGGICVSDGNQNTLIENNTIFNNNASNGGGITVDYRSSGTTVRNNIVWGNTGGVTIEDGGVSSVTYNCVENGFTGTGNISTDPLFVDPLNNDFRLQAGSPCIDTGDPNSPLDPDGTRADMGVIPFLDSDSDGLSDEDELSYGTDPYDQDTDDDGLSDGEEVLTFSTDPLTVDSDSDGIQDGTEVGNDTWWLGEPWNGIGGTDTNVNIPDADPSTTTNPLDDDSDDDGLRDGEEDMNADGAYAGQELDPNNFDSDGDSLSDGLELGLVAPNGVGTNMNFFVSDSDPLTTTNPRRRDTDGGGLHDNIEDWNKNGAIDAGETDPRDANDDAGLLLRIDPVYEGGTAMFRVFNGGADAYMYLCYSLFGSGPYTTAGGLTLELSLPIGQLSPFRLDSQGNGTLGPFPVPPNVLVGDHLWFQGVQFDLWSNPTTAVSNMVPVTVEAEVPPTEGSLHSWGHDNHGQVSNTPTTNDFVQVAGGGFYSVALKSDGSLVSWGYDGHGQVSNTPTTNDFVQVAGLGGHSLALKSDGSLVSWGDDSYGQVSNTPTTNDFVKVATGHLHSVALKSDGSLVSWGHDGYGQVSNTPTTNDFTQAAGGEHHSVALKSDGSLVSWGYDGHGQVANTPTTNGFVQVAGGGNHSVALKSDGSLVSWGYDSDGQVSNTPTTNDFVQVAVGHLHSVALKSDGSLVSWGYDGHGQVSNTPTTNDVIRVSAADWHSIAIRN